jgi:hypothetical protein
MDMHRGYPLASADTLPPGQHTPGVKATRKTGRHRRLIAVRFGFARSRVPSGHTRLGTP